MRQASSLAVGTGAEAERRLGERIEALRRAVEGVVRGKSDVVRRCLVALFAGGHVLIEDVPGVGKTLLARALARFIDASFRRIQFTSDLLPSDIVGVAVFDPARGEFQFQKGPIFANIVLADEINRTTPKTQSALLEAMNEGQTSVDGVTYPLPRPFFVLGTQNPIEHHGTFPLPESQLDRFLMRIRIGYPDEAHEAEILKSQRRSDPLEEARPVLSREDVLAIQKAVRSVRVDDALADYLVRIASATRRSDALALGVSTRGTLLLQRAAQAQALVDGRDYVVPDDVKAVAVSVLAHRVVPRVRRAAADGEASAVESLVAEILDTVPVPL